MDRTELEQSLRKHPLTERLVDSHLKHIAAAGEVEHYLPDETIVEEGSIGDAIFLILDGRTAVHKSGSGGRRLAELTEGDFFGEMCLVEPARRCASVMAVEPTTIFRLPNKALVQMAAFDPITTNALLAAVIRTLSDRLRRMNEALTEVSQLSDWLKGSMV